MNFLGKNNPRFGDSPLKLSKSAEVQNRGKQQTVKILKMLKIKRFFKSPFFTLRVLHFIFVEVQVLSVISVLFFFRRKWKWKSNFQGQSLDWVKRPEGKMFWSSSWPVFGCYSFTHFFQERNKKERRTETKIALLASARTFFFLRKNSQTKRSSRSVTKCGCMPCVASGI